MNRIILLFLSFALFFSCTSIETQKEATPPIDNPIFGRKLLIDSTSLRNIELAPSLSFSLELIIQISVDQNGIIRSISIDKSTGYSSIDNDILEAVSIWRFESTILTEPTMHSVVFSIIKGRISNYYVYQL